MRNHALARVAAVMLLGWGSLTTTLRSEQLAGTRWKGALFRIQQSLEIPHLARGTA
jgi:hypothetical protein